MPICAPVDELEGRPTPAAVDRAADDDALAAFGWRQLATILASRLRLPLADQLHLQAWNETLFGHVKGESPHLEKIRDPAVLATELEVVRADYNGRRLHAGIAYVTPDDEHAGRGPGVRRARAEGLARARTVRLAYHRHPDDQYRP